MSQTASARSTANTIRATVVTLLVVSAAIIGVLEVRSSTSSFAGPPSGTQREFPQVAPTSAPSVREIGGPDPTAGINAARAITGDDGVLPDGVTVFDDEYPGVGNLDRALVRALRAASLDAASDGIELSVNSGWRSPEYQDRLLREAIARYGSAKEAARWVATADTSPHVSGDAVDIGSAEATAWLAEHGARYGLCQIYRNEPWHYELRRDGMDLGCPATYADPTRDPRMRR